MPALESVVRRGKHALGKPEKKSVTWLSDQEMLLPFFFFSFGCFVFLFTGFSELIVHTLT